MAQEIRADFNAAGRRFAIVAARFNRPIAEQVVDGAVECLTRHGCSDDAIDITYVPGAFEVPQNVSAIAKRGGCDAIIAIAVIIRGETPHFDFLARSVTADLARLGLDHGLPVAYGVVTADTVDQAQIRAGVKQSGKGWDAAMAAIEMANLFETFSAKKKRR